LFLPNERDYSVLHKKRTFGMAKKETLKVKAMNPKVRWVSAVTLLFSVTLFFFPLLSVAEAPKRRAFCPRQGEQKEVFQ